MSRDWKKEKQPYKAKFEFTLHMAFDVHGPSALISGPDTDRHAKSMRFVSENGLHPITIIENDPDRFEIIKRSCDHRKNIDAVFINAEDFDYSPFRFIDLDLMKGLPECYEAFSNALYDQSISNKLVPKAFLITFSIRNSITRTECIKLLNELFYLVDASIYGFDNISNGWGKPYHGNYHHANFRKKGRINKMLAFSYKERLNNGTSGNPMFTLGFEYI